MCVSMRMQVCLQLCLQACHVVVWSIVWVFKSAFISVQECLQVCMSLCKSKMCVLMIFYAKFSIFDVNLIKKSLKSFKKWLSPFVHGEIVNKSSSNTLPTLKVSILSFILSWKFPIFPSKFIYLHLGSPYLAKFLILEGERKVISKSSFFVWDFLYEISNT